MLQHQCFATAHYPFKLKWLFLCWILYWNADSLHTVFLCTHSNENQPVFLNQNPKVKLLHFVIKEHIPLNGYEHLISRNSYLGSAFCKVAGCCYHDLSGMPVRNSKHFIYCTRLCLLSRSLFALTLCLRQFGMQKSQSQCQPNSVYPPSFFCQRALNNSHPSLFTHHCVSFNSIR